MMKESDGIRTVPVSKVFREALTSLRKLCKMTQKEMAEALSISPQYYNDLERGRRTPSVHLVHTITGFCQLGHRKAAVRAWHVMAARTHGWEV